MFLQVSIRQSDCDCSNYKKCENPKHGCGTFTKPDLSERERQRGHKKVKKERQKKRKTDRQKHYKNKEKKGRKL